MRITLNSENETPLIIDFDSKYNLKALTLVIWLREHIHKNVSINFDKDIQDAMIDQRPMIRYLSEQYFINKFNKLIGAEIGVSGGTTSLSILKNLSIKKLYLIDPYIEYSEDHILYKKVLNHSGSKKVMMKLLKPYQDKCVLIEKMSSDAINDIEEKLDFVYIDGNHSYDIVKSDINSYYKKLKIGGIIGGHDFNPETPGVALAVLEFQNKNNIPVHCKKNSPQTDWWIIKTKEI